MKDDEKNLATLFIDLFLKKNYKDEKAYWEVNILINVIFFKKLVRILNVGDYQPYE